MVSEQRKQENNGKKMGNYTHAAHSRSTAPVHAGHGSRRRRVHHDPKSPYRRYKPLFRYYRAGNAAIAGAAGGALVGSVVSSLLWASLIAAVGAVICGFASILDTD